MKKIISLILSGILSLTALTACSGTSDGGSEDAQTSTSSGNKDNTTITVAASSAPHAEILEQCKTAMADKGYTLEIKVMDDYVTPNMATDSGDVDANYFQHQPYLDQFNSENGTKLVSVAKIHYEPFGIYAGQVSTIDAIEDGAVIAVPNDATNEARALLLLEANGLIKLEEGAGLTATKKSIVENPKNLDIREMEAALLPTVLDEVAVAVINGNYAISAGLKASEAIAIEDSQSEAAQTYANVLVVKEGNENLDSVKALIEVITSDAIRDYINNTYEGAVVPIF